MGTTRLVEHLENIKIYSDFLKSGLSDFSEFWELIEEGRPFLNLQDKVRIEPLDPQIDPTQAELKSIEERREWISNNRLDELYCALIRERLMSILEWDNRTILNLFELADLESIIFENDKLEKYLDISRQELQFYTDTTEVEDPNQFFQNYSALSKEILQVKGSSSLLLKKYTQITVDAHREFFNNGGYRLFTFLSDFLGKSASDIAFIFWKLKEDKFIHNSISEGDFRRFLDSSDLVFDRLKPLGTVSNDKRESIYRLASNFILNN